MQQASNERIYTSRLCTYRSISEYCCTIDLGQTNVILQSTYTATSGSMGANSQVNLMHEPALGSLANLTLFSVPQAPLPDLLIFHQQPSGGAAASELVGNRAGGN